MSELWCYAESLPDEGEVVLSAEEARHVSARRLKVNDKLVVFDGAGRVAQAQLTSMARRETKVNVTSIELVAAPPEEFVIASAIPKGDRLSTMLQMLSQLGSVRWQPLLLEDSAVRKIDPSSSRSHRILIESAKVARRAWILAIDVPTDLETAIERHGAGGSIVFGDREGKAAPFGGGTRLIMIGPEAGFTESERGRLLKREARPVSFGAYNLRIEVAAIAAATVHNVSAGHNPGQRGADGASLEAD